MNGSKAPHPSPLPKGEGIDRGALKNSAILPPLPLGEGKGRTRISLLFAALLFTPLAHAFDLQQLSEQLAKPQVIHGDFIQEKHLRALPKPLTSTGTFVLAKDHGLLWQLKTPLQQDYRINAQGIARRDGTQWQMLPGKSAGAEQNRLFLAVLQGDSSGLQRDFDLQLQGEPSRWTLTLTPRSLLLKQVFTRINIEGGELVQRIELQEAQGDSTLLKMPNSVGNQPLSDAEQNDFAQ
ncbi:outer membrane lipoprotein carrier protein LolA [Pseudomonas sp. TWR1-1-3]|uniref:outer membrane lipoprotein carrier protein LolA n=1 Tax=Pseudomonas sp. TWR1-1-3 TaxID=2804624 RepID=UPI003CF0A88F